MTDAHAPSPLESSLRDLAQAARSAARPLARASAETRSRAIVAIADGLESARDAIEKANAEDLGRGKASGLSAAMLDRLDLRGERLSALATTVREIAAQDDPLGATTREWERPNGLKVRKVRLPLGVILMIYESRPNVTVDAAALCIKSGNAAILRGGSEAAATNAALESVVQAALKSEGLPAGAVQRVPTQDRGAIDILVTFDELINLVIPRGGEKLIRRVASTSRIPVVQHYKGVCHMYIDATADVGKAVALVENAKVQRPGVCNALETVLIDASIAASVIPTLTKRLRGNDVELRGCARTAQIDGKVLPATDADWDTEFLDLILAIRVVDGVEGAIAHIDAHGTQHTASIVTGSDASAERFTREVDASCVMVNASTRFNDGGQLGLGAEMGISTTRIHAYGPMGVESLTAEKFVVIGDGHVRP